MREYEGGCTMGGVRGVVQGQAPVRVQPTRLSKVSTEMGTSAVTVPDELLLGINVNSWGPVRVTIEIIL